MQVTSLAGQGDLDRECRVERATRREPQPWVAVPASHLPGRKAGDQGRGCWWNGKGINSLNAYNVWGIQ